MRWWSTTAARHHPRTTTMVRSTSSFHPSQRFQSTATTNDSSHTTATSSTTTTTTHHPHTFVPYPIVRKDDFGPNQEYSVIHTDRSLNLMSIPFQTVMKDLYHCFNHTYRAAHTIIIPGSGTFGMESVARQFAHNQHTMVLRNGWFSYRWTEILDMMTGPCTGCTQNTTTHTVLSAQPVVPPTKEDTDINTLQPQYQPMPIEQVVEHIHQERPAVFFCPHVETSTGIILPDSYIQQIATAMRAVNGLLVLDCIASGCIWIDMEALGVDILITAPQKGWSGPPCAAFVCMSSRAMERLQEQVPNQETSFSLSLKRWSAVMDAYVKKGSFAYHTTMPTDALRDFHQVTVELLSIGTDRLKEHQYLLGQKVRDLFRTKYELRSVAAPGYDAPGVLVFYSPGINVIENPKMMQLFQTTTTTPPPTAATMDHSTRPLQIAMGVPWKLLSYEPNGLKTFRMGLFGLDKLMHLDPTIQTIDTKLGQVYQQIHDEYQIPLPSSLSPGQSLETNK